jgi:hypothetical protein
VGRRSAQLEVDAGGRILAAEGPEQAGLPGCRVGDTLAHLIGGEAARAVPASLPPAGTRRCPGLLGGLIASQGVELDFGLPGGVAARCSMRVPLGGDARP